MGHKYIKEDDMFNTSQNGVVPKPTAQDISNNKFLRADGSWASGAGGSVVSADQIVSSGIEIGGVTIDGQRTAFYAPFPMHTYSEIEQCVGTWIDQKPVYEITINLSTAVTVRANTWTNIVDISGLNIDTLVDFVGQPSTLQVASANAMVSGAYLQVLLAFQWAIKIVTLRYTKTTDNV